MASHIPLALSLLQAVTSQQPNQKNPNFPQPSAVPTLAKAAVSYLTGNQKPSNNTHATHLCDFCHLRPKFIENGHAHPFCSKTCANQSKRSAPQVAPPVKNDMCEVCHQRPKYRDGGQLLDYCGKTCAANAPKATIPPVPRRIPQGTCKVPNCGKQAHADASGIAGDYCSIAHRKLGQTHCLLCQMAPKQERSHFCGKRCTEEAEKLGPLLLEVPKEHVTFTNVADQFMTAWRHPKGSPRINHIYKVMGSKKSLAAYTVYQKSVEARGNFGRTGRSVGNENRRFHGTKRECQIGDTGQTRFCTSPSCSLCSILRHSFNLDHFGQRTKWGRFGKGIYTSSTSSKANDYSKNASASKLKVVVLAKVIVGRGCKMTENNPQLTSAPAGYDSVLGETGGSLNWDELVVYDNDGIRPSYLIMYTL